MASTGRFRIQGLVFEGGTVTLDGSNPTSVDASAFCSSILYGMAEMGGSVAPGDDPSLITCVVNGASLDIYAWKNTGGTDPTLVASTDNARVINYFIVGVELPRKGS